MSASGRGLNIAPALGGWSRVVARFFGSSRTRGFGAPTFDLALIKASQRWRGLSGWPGSAGRFCAHSAPRASRSSLTRGIELLQLRAELGDALQLRSSGLLSNTLERLLD